MSTIVELLAYYKKVIDTQIDQYLPKQTQLPPKIHESMRYSALGGGKRIRPILVLETCKMLSGSYQEALPSAVAIELAHCFTLIHDDLPSIDNDDLRRGQPTNHIVYGEAISLLAGDALMIDAFRILAKHQKPNRHVKKIILELADALSSQGVIGGQVADVLAEKAMLDHSLKVLEYIHLQKTARLIEAALTIGAIIGDASEDELSKLKQAGQYLGLAFQIKDDILDIEGETMMLGKNIGRDLDLGKLTYPKQVGLSKSKEKLQILRNKAFDEINGFSNADNLRLIFDFLINRNH